MKSGNRFWVVTLAVWMGFLLFSGVMEASEGGNAVIAGRVAVSDAGPLRGGVFLFDAATGPAPNPDQYIRVATWVEVLKPDGAFEMHVPPGDYYLGAILRKSEGPELGPPRPGDLVVVGRGDDGKAIVYKLVSGGRTDIGALESASEYRGLTAEKSIRIEGTVVDTDGTPVPGVIVFAFRDRNMSGLPTYVSEKTSSKGGFFLPLGERGTYYLKVRPEYGGGPLAGGGVIGTYGGAEPTGIEVSAEKPVVKGIRIQVMNLPPAGPARRTLREKGSLTPGEMPGSMPLGPAGPFEPSKPSGVRPVK